MATKVLFVYDEQCGLWETYVSGVKDSIEARQAFNAVALTAQMAIPRVDANRADEVEPGIWHISVGQYTNICN